MKRLYFYIAAAAALFLLKLLPLQGTDVAELLPVRVMLVEAEDGLVRVRCDHDAEGAGKNWELALADLQSSAEGQVFFGTIEHVVLAPSAWYLMPRLAASTELRPAAKLYYGPQELPEAEEAAAFLHAHPGGLTLCQARAALLSGGHIHAPRLVETEGRLLLAE